MPRLRVPVIAAGGAPVITLPMAWGRRRTAGTVTTGVTIDATTDVMIVETTAATAVTTTTIVVAIEPADRLPASLD
jgi:hypothetical protein